MPEQLAIFKSLQHPTRMEILKFLGDHPQDIPYTDLLDFVEGSTGKLNYHLRTLDDLVFKTDNGYNITEKGRRILSWLKSYEFPNDMTYEFEKPEVIFNKLYPAVALKYKLWMQAFLVFSPFLIPIAVFTYFIRSPVMIIIWAALILLICYFSQKYYQSIWYRISDTEIEVFRGILTRTHKIVPFRTVTNVDLQQGIFDRLFGLSTVNIHTAGYSTATYGAESQIIGMVEGEEIKDTILERIRLLNPIDFMKTENKYTNKSGKNLGPALLELKNELQSLNEEVKK